MRDIFLIMAVMNLGGAFLTKADHEFMIAFALAGWVCLGTWAILVELRK